MSSENSEEGSKNQRPRWRCEKCGKETKAAELNPVVIDEEIILLCPSCLKSAKAAQKIKE